MAVIYSQNMYIEVIGNGLGLTDQRLAVVERRSSGSSSATKAIASAGPNIVL